MNGNKRVIVLSMNQAGGLVRGQVCYRLSLLTEVQSWHGVVSREQEVLNTDGARWLEWTDRTITDDQGCVREVQSLGETTLRRLSRRLLQLRDEERWRIALHDSTAQNLAALSLNLTVVETETARLTEEARKEEKDDQSGPRRMTHCGVEKAANIVDQSLGVLRDERHQSTTHGGRSTVMHKMMIFGPMALSVLMVASNGLADEGKHGKETRMKVSGVVSKVQSSQVTVKTPWGQMVISSTAGPENLKVGEEVEMQVNEENIVIDVHRKGEPAHGHRFVAGKLVYAGLTKQEIKLWTPEGEKVFPLERMEVKTKPIAEGSPVIVELNEAGSVIDLRQSPTIEMSLDEHARTKPGYQMSVNGVVTKIQSGVIFVKSPVGQYTISAKSAPSDAKVGDEVTLWVNEENMVVDHHRKGHDKGVHRLISGKLIYAGLTKKEIKLRTPEGEKVFPLDRMEVKTKPIPEGSMIIVELNEEGTVVDLRKAP